MPHSINFDFGVNKVKFKEKSPLTFQYLSEGQELKKKEEKRKKKTLI
jgi:hypothetical protein